MSREEAPGRGQRPAHQRGVGCERGEVVGREAVEPALPFGGQFPEPRDRFNALFEAEETARNSRGPEARAGSRIQAMME